MWTTVFVFLALGSVWFMFSANPEEKMVQSTDGEVTVTGVAKASAPLRVVTVTDAIPMIASGGTSINKSYRIMPDATLLAKPVVLTWQLKDLLVSASEVAVYRFNEDSLMWDMVLPIVAYSDTMLAVETSTLGVFTLGKKETVTVPQFIDVYKDILVSKPVGAVGFVTTVGYVRASPSPSITGGGSIMRLPSVGQQGGCGGAVEPGVTEQKSTVTRDVTLLVDDVQTKVTLTFFTRWMMGDGCPVDSPFQSSSSYGILPISN